MFTHLLSRYWLLLPLLVLVVIALDRIETPLPMEIEQTIDMRQTRSDYYLAGFKTLKFRADGSVEYTVQGDTLAHYPDNDRSEIIAPRIKLKRPGADWDISSARGRFDTKPDLFTLEGEVVVQRQRINAEPITITTNQLTIATGSNQVSTDALIEIVSAHWALKAKGMTSAIDDGTLTLLSSVSARYDVPAQ